MTLESEIKAIIGEQPGTPRARITLRHERRGKLHRMFDDLFSTRSERRFEEPELLTLADPEPEDEVIAELVELYGDLPEDFDLEKGEDNIFV